MDTTPPPPSSVRPSIADVSAKRYGLDRWGRSFLRVNELGHVVMHAPDTPPVDLHEVAEVLRARGYGAPFVLRFPTLVRHQLERLHAAFQSAIAANEYRGGHHGVYPLKVNQRRSVVESVVRGGEGFHWGLEAGSKPELLLAMAQPPREGALLLCNGFKDREFLRMAHHAAELGHHVVVVMESVREVQRILEVSEEREWMRLPELGMRAKLYSRGSGKWQSSGGEGSKFGLTTREILAVTHKLSAAGQIARLRLLHFHIGSQITQIKRIKQAAREAARLYAALRAYAPALDLLDLGGGIGVDYDGSRTSFPSSANYSIEEYASQVVYEVGQVVAQTQVPAPTIVTESGRVVVSSHAVTVVDLREVQGEPLPLPERRPDEHRLITQLRETLDGINVKNYEEYFHDAVDFREEALGLFSAGYLTIEDRAAAEGLFAEVRDQTARLLPHVKKPNEEVVEALKRAQRKYLANFSIFQSLPDTWSIDQVFPVAPLSRHGDRPTVYSQIVDITCDSDGCLTEFAHPDDNLRSLPLHERGAEDEGEGYYLGFFHTGAYQDSLGNVHNLFGRGHEVIVRDPDEDLILPGSERIEVNEVLHLEVQMGMTNAGALEAMDFDNDSVLQNLRDRHLDHETSLGKAWALGLLQSYPYLAP
jgi:arginine decarboxylase